MRDFAILIIQMFGYAMIVGFFLSIVNYFFDWHLGIYDVEMPNHPGLGAILLFIGLICSGLGYWLDKKYPTSPPAE